jgi:hypothetical protein
MSSNQLSQNMSSNQLSQKIACENSLERKVFSIHVCHFSDCISAGFLVTASRCNLQRVNQRARSMFVIKGVVIVAAYKWSKKQDLVYFNFYKVIMYRK